MTKAICVACGRSDGADEPVPPLGIMGWEAIGVSSWGWIECQVRLQHRWDTEGH